MSKTKWFMLIVLGVVLLTTLSACKFEPKPCNRCTVGGRTLICIVWSFEQSGGRQCITCLELGGSRTRTCASTISCVRVLCD